MEQNKWHILQKSARMQALPETPVSLIVDSPWIPGYLGISMLDYFSMPEVWLQANLAVERKFPEAIFLPGFWVEMGMAAEPSGFGCRVSFYDDQTPLAHPLISSVEEADRLPQPDPRSDGLMPFILNIYRRMEPKVNDAGHHIKMVAARGPLAVATHLMGVTDFLLGLKLDPENTHRLLKKTTRLAKEWLEAQAEALTEVESVMLLDDIAGFLSPKDYLEFAHPYLKEIFDAFPDALKVFHNDMNNPVSYPYMQELPVHIFNFSHLQELDKVRQLVGPQVCLMGNVAPLDVLAKGSPQEVSEAAMHCLASHPDRKGLLLSAGGGVSPGTPGENIRALIAAAQKN